MNRSALRLAVADDDPAVLPAIVDLVDSCGDIELAGVATDHPGLLALVRETHPDVVLMDIRMPGGTGPDVIRQLRLNAPDTAVVALSALGDRETVLSAVEAGAAGYLVKGGPDSEVLEAVARAHRGQFSVSVALVADAVTRVTHDLEQCQHVEQALRRSENMLHHLLDRAPAGVVLIGPGDRIRLANAQADRVFGRAPGSLVGKASSTLVPERRRPQFLALLERMSGSSSDSSSVVPEELDGQRADGSEFPALFEITPLVLKDQRYVGLFVTDLSSSRTAGSRYLRLIESAPDALLVVDRERTIDLVNVRAEQLFGFARGELISRPLEVILPGAPAELFEPGRVAQQVAQGGAEDGLSLTAQRKDGAKIPVDVRLNTLRTAEDIFVVATVRNMSAARRQEAVLERSFQYLQNIDRAHHQLLSYLVRAQEAERERITVGIHDDTLQAMTAASLRVQQLRRRLVEQADLDVVHKLEETIQLSIARLRHLMFDLRPPALDGESLGEALQRYIDQLAANGGLQYSVQDDLTADLPPEMQVIAYRIAQEALTNVWLHAQATSVRVEISAVDDGCLVVIEDDGRGYDPADAEGMRDHLGLTLMQERAHIAGGWCRVESAPGAGTSVQFWLPSSNEAAEPEHEHPLLSGSAR